MGVRRRSRECAMQVLFFMDVSRNMSPEMVELFCNCFAPSESVYPFFSKLTNGVIRSKSEIDTVIEGFSDNWKMNRMSSVDRNVMRIAVYELLYCDDIPPKVSINEAIDVGKKYGTEESGAFINGILDSIHQAMRKGDCLINVEKRKERLNESQGGSQRYPVTK